ncbi:phosphotransferase [Promicromonospora sp. Marseille-Q5078]
MIPDRTPRLDAEEMLAEVNRRTGAGLQLTGLADHGEVGAAYVRWPDRRAGVLTRTGATVEEVERTGRLLTRAAAAGVPVPAYQAIVDLGTARALIQGRLRGAAPAQVDNDLVRHLLDLVETFAGLGDHADDLELYLSSSGPGFCLHETLMSHDDRSRRLLARVREIGLDGSCERGDDLVHLDFHPGNVLVQDGRVTGLVDWDGAARGDRRFALTTLSFDLSHRLRTRTGCHGLDRAGLGEVLDRMAGAPQQPLRRWWAHMSLRQVDWSIRHAHGAAVVDWYQTIAERGLDRLDAGRSIRCEDLVD